MMIIKLISAIAAGFSIVSCLILLLAYLFFLSEMRKTYLGKVAACFVLLGLGALQVGHFLYFVQASDLLDSRVYCILLMVLPGSFFFFSREILFFEARHRLFDLLHFVPLVLGFLLPLSTIPAVAFTIGTGYTFWFARSIYQLRDQRNRFKFEIFFFGLFALMAAVALMLGLSLPVIDHSIFFIAYGNSISIAMMLVVAALLIFSELLSDIAVITELAYSRSKLLGINTKQKIAQLEELMTQDKLYENDQISLASVAENIELSSHQLSELINTEYGYNFPRFIREHRVRAAKTLLVAEPDTSVLAISMMIGFKSQSSFYTAFKESTGEAPGNFRQKRASKTV